VFSVFIDDETAEIFSFCGGDGDVTHDRVLSFTGYCVCQWVSVFAEPFNEEHPRKIIRSF
jgi:hypothetical protein